MDIELSSVEPYEIVKGDRLDLSGAYGAEVVSVTRLIRSKLMP